MTRDEQMAAIIADYPIMLGNAAPDNRRFFTVTQDDDDSHWHSSYDTLDEALVGLADEVQGERSWWPVVIRDLDLEVDYVAQVHVSVTATPSVPS